MMRIPMLLLLLLLPTAFGAPKKDKSKEEQLVELWNKLCAADACVRKELNNLKCILACVFLMGMGRSLGVHIIFRFLVMAFVCTLHYKLSCHAMVPLAQFSPSPGPHPEQEVVLSGPEPPAQPSPSPGLSGLNNNDNYNSLFPNPYNRSQPFNPLNLHSLNLHPLNRSPHLPTYLVGNSFDDAFKETMSSRPF